MSSIVSLPDLFSAIHENLRAAMPESWPDLRALAESFLQGRRPEALLPLASCQAAGGDPVLATPVSAAIVATEISLVILDDLYDQDRPAALARHLGPGRAHNVASVFQTLSFRVLMDAPWAPEMCQRILRVLCDGYLEIAAGQDRDLATTPTSLESYWKIAEKKTGCGYATAMEAGARVATAEESVILALRAFGFHTGLAVQVFNDLRGVWSPMGKSDLEQGKVGLPVVYALSCEHPDRGFLETAVKAGQLARHHDTVRQILDRIDARAFLVWAALKHRESALEALSPVPLGPGRAFLFDFITGCFGNIDELLAASPPA